MTTRRLLCALGISVCAIATGCGSSGSGNSGSPSGGAGGAGSGTGGTSSGGTSSGGTSSGGSGTGGTSSGGTSSGGTSSGGTSSGGSAGSAAGGSGGTSSGGQHIKTVFLIVMENHNWSDIKGSSSAPYINNTLLPESSYATQYYDPGVHPSEPNYIWLEAGTNFGITSDSNPSTNELSSTKHLTRQLRDAGISWKSYQEDISGKVCPLTGTGLYAPKHNPNVFFDDMTNNLSSTSSYCIKHNVPYTQLATDMKNNTVPRYAFITPNLCHDMHNTCAPENNSIKQGDDWLKSELPKIMASKAYKDNGAIFITWDESENGEHPIGMIVLSPLAKGGGYTSSIHYTHSSTLRTFQEIFGVKPFLGAAAQATDLSAMFKSFP